MKALKLLRRMENAGLIHWFPEDGNPVVEWDGERLVRHWTEMVELINGDFISTYDTPDDEYPSFVCTKRFLDIMAA